MTWRGARVKDETPCDARSATEARPVADSMTGTANAEMAPPQGAVEPKSEPKSAFTGLSRQVGGGNSKTS